MNAMFINFFFNIKKRNQHKQFPVLVYIHGGGFNMGMSGTKESPGYFMDENVVLVSSHYRIGTLGM